MQTRSKFISHDFKDETLEAKTSWFLGKKMEDRFIEALEDMVFFNQIRIVEPADEHTSFKTVRIVERKKS